MKKIITSFFAVAALTVSAQTVDFESITLASESYDNGSAGNGDFSIDYLTFTNYYDAAWGSWNGFSVSNVTDNTTAGFGNQYGSFVGSGNNSSENFGVFYPLGDITVGGSGFVTGFHITNTTYAGISMRDGDAFSKQFGSPNDASGTPDGTNGEDYFRVWIIVEDLNQMKDSMEYYLADYRFVDDNDDYIIDTWQQIDLTGLSVAANKVTFRFESSDVGQWGVNTPTYVAIDDIEYSMPLGTAELDQVSMQLYPNPANDYIIVSGMTGELTISSLTGQVVTSQEIVTATTIDLSSLEAGVYTATVMGDKGTSTKRFVVK